MKAGVDGLILSPLELSTIRANNMLFKGGVSRNGAKHIVGINGVRDANGRILVPTVTKEDFAKYAEVALTDEVLNTVQVLDFPSSANRPLLFVPDVPVLGVDDITLDEVIDFLRIAGQYDGVELASYSLSEMFKGFFSQWSAREHINGPDGDPHSFSGVVIPTAYDSKNAKLYSEQKAMFEAWQKAHEGVIDARLFHSALLACTKVNDPVDRDLSHVCSVGLDAKLYPASRGVCVLEAVVGERFTLVCESPAGPGIDNRVAARFAVRTKPLVLGH